jgi:DNA-binding response OmpR family regulator
MGYSPKVCELLHRVRQLELDLAFYRGATDAEPVQDEAVRKLGLTHNEGLLYAALMGARPRVVSIGSLEDAVPPRDHVEERSANLMHVVVAKIRRKIGKDAIECVWGRGFRIADSWQPPA